MEKDTAENEFLTRLNAFRDEVQRCDWTCDKFLSLGGNKGYSYISSDKCRRNIAPLLVKHGFEFIPVFSELTLHPSYGNIPNHWTVKLDGTLKDVATGRTITATTYGECGDSGDKGAIKAQTAAIKQWILTTQMLTEGIDPYDDTTPAGGSFRKQTPEEVEEVKSKILSRGVAAEPKPEPKAEPKAEPKVEVTGEENLDGPRETPKEAPKEEPKEEPKETPQEPSETFKGDVTLPEGLSPIHRAAVEKILQRYTQGAANGTVSPVEFNQMAMDIADIEDAKDAVAFIKKYKE